MLPKCTGAPGEKEKVTCWPPPEVPQNIDKTMGNLGLTEAEEDQLVAFLKTLTDGYTRPYTDFDSFKGVIPKPQAPEAPSAADKGGKKTSGKQGKQKVH